MEDGEDFEFGTDGVESVISYSVIFIVLLHFLYKNNTKCEIFNSNSFTSCEILIESL